jgi:hypothetical protein
MVNTDSTALIGYSTGGYGVVNTTGGGFEESVLKFATAPPNGVLAARRSGNAAYTATMASCTLARSFF